MQQNRKLCDLIKRRLGEKAPLIQVIIGPRQVGKTTALKAALEGRGFYESADSPTPLPASSIEAWWKSAYETQDRILAIDEVQKVSGWSEIIKKLWDRQDRPLKVVLTGSASLVVEKGLQETLAGRFELIRAEHWNFEEARNTFGLSLEDYISFGAYPGALRFRTDIERWALYVRDSIVEPAIGRDLLALQPVDHPALLRQTFGVAVSLPAQIVSLQKLQGQLQGKGSLPTIQNYLDLLHHAFLVTGIQKYSATTFKSKRSSPKLIVHDNGLIRAFERPVQNKLSPERFGHYLENVTGARFLEAGWDTYYWKERNHEVDFVVIGPQNEHWAIEVKTAATERKNLQGLLEFCKLYPEFEPHLVSMDNQAVPGIGTLKIDDVLALHRKYSP